MDLSDDGRLTNVGSEDGETGVPLDTRVINLLVQDGVEDAVINQKNKGKRVSKRNNKRIEREREREK